MFFDKITWSKDAQLAPDDYYVVELSKSQDFVNIAASTRLHRTSELSGSEPLQVNASYFVVFLLCI